MLRGVQNKGQKIKTFAIELEFRFFSKQENIAKWISEKIKPDLPKLSEKIPKSAFCSSAIKKISKSNLPEISYRIVAADTRIPITGIKNAIVSFDFDNLLLKAE